MVQLSDNTGAVTKTYTYDAFGNETNPDPADENPLRYAGEQYDAETGTYYLRARYYDAKIGRFTGEDSVKDGLNWYVYCSSNPVMFIDPSGNIRQAGYYTINGVYAWYADPDASEFGAGSDTYKILVDAGDRWMSSSSQSDRDSLHGTAEEVRRMAREGTPAVYAQEKVESLLMDAEALAESTSQDILNNLANIPGYDVGAERIRIFIGLVKNGSILDIKRQDGWIYPYDTYHGEPAKYKTMTAYMYYDGVLWSAEELGNYSFGYFGAAYGYSEEFLCFGAGAYQITTDYQGYSFLGSYWDDPRDQAQIRDGYNRYFNR